MVEHEITNTNFNTNTNKNENMSADTISLVFGCGKRERDLIKKWNKYVTEVMMKDENWPPEYDVWHEQDADCGEIKSSKGVDKALVIAIITMFLTENGFRDVSSEFGKLEFAAINPMEVPTTTVDWPIH